MYTNRDLAAASMSPKKARSASVACLVDWSFKKLSIALTSVLSVRHSIAKAPCPTAGKAEIMGDYFSDPIGISETSQSCRSKDYSIHLAFVKLPQTRIDVAS